MALTDALGIQNPIIPTPPVRAPFRTDAPQPFSPSEPAIAPPVVPEQFKGRTGSEVLARSADLTRQAAEMTEPIARAQAQIRQEKTTQESDIAKYFADEERKLREEAQKKKEEMPITEFSPTRDNLETISNLFSIMGVVGMLTGKSNAMGAMSAMTGMLEGWKAGRKDLFSKEKQIYEKNISEIKTKHDMVDKGLQNALALLPRDKEAAIAEMNKALAVSESPLLQQIAKQQGLKAAADASQKVGQLLQAHELRVQESQRRADDARARRAHEADMRRLAQERIDMQRQVADAKANAPKAALKAGDKTQTAYISDHIMKADLSDIAKDLSNPAIKKLVKDYRIEAFLTEKGTALDQFFQQEIPSELRQFLTKVRQVRNKYYVNTSGLAVTNGEALRSYGVVPQPGDSPEVMLDKINGLINGVDRMIQFRKSLYSLPDISSSPGVPTGIDASFNATPPEPALTAPAQSAPKEGDTGVSKSGKPTIFRNNQWEYQ